MSASAPSYANIQGSLIKARAFGLRRLIACPKVYNRHGRSHQVEGEPQLHGSVFS